MKKNDFYKYENFKLSCPAPFVENLEDIERQFQFQINIWYQKSSTDAPELRRQSSFAEFEELNLLSRSYCATNKSLR